MTKSQARCRIDAVGVGELQVNLLTPHPVLEAKYALMNSETAQRMGAGNRNVWSEETMSKLFELIAQMEKDICMDVFGEATTDSVVAFDDHFSDGVPGL